MSVTRIPFASTAPSAAPLRRCIRPTAARMALSPVSVTLLLNHFLEELAREHFLHELAHEVSLGRTIRLPVDKRSKLPLGGAADRGGG